MTDLAQFAAQCRSFPAALDKASRDGTRKVALGLTVTVRTFTAAAAPAGRLNVGKAGKKIGARFDVKGDGSALVRVTGPYQLIERDTKAHPMPRPRGQGRRKVLLIPGIGYRRVVQHPGTRGKHPFERAVRAFSPTAPVVWQREVHAAIGRVFR